MMKKLKNSFYLSKMIFGAVLACILLIITDETSKTKYHNNTNVFKKRAGAMKYTVKSWRVPLITYTVHNQNDPLQAKIYNLCDAGAEAKRLSRNGHKAVVMEWFEDYNMY